MSFNSVGLYQDQMVVTTGVKIPAPTLVKGRKFKTFGSLTKEEEQRGLTGHTKASEVNWCRAYCKSRGVNWEALTDELNQLIDLPMSVAGVNARLRTIKRYYLWVASAWMRSLPAEEQARIRARARAGSPYRNVEALILEWIQIIHERSAGKCKRCKDTGLLVDKLQDWQYCKCTAGIARKDYIMAEVA